MRAQEFDRVTHTFGGRVGGENGVLNSLNCVWPRGVFNLYKCKHDRVWGGRSSHPPPPIQSIENGSSLLKWNFNASCQPINFFWLTLMLMLSPRYHSILPPYARPFIQIVLLFNISPSLFIIFANVEYFAHFPRNKIYNFYL